MVLLTPALFDCAPKSSSQRREQGRRPQVLPVVREGRVAPQPRPLVRAAA